MSPDEATSVGRISMEALSVNFNLWTSLIVSKGVTCPPTWKL